MDPDEALKRVPTLRMLTFSLEELKARAVQLSEVIRKRTGDALEVNVMEDISQVGGGALPENPLPTFVVSLGSPAISVNALEKSFRFADPPVIGRIQKDRFFLDVRTVLDHEFEKIAMAAERAIELKGKKDSTG
jgi:L-seryl-tRNA(Ser) seleniumtransferase